MQEDEQQIEENQSLIIEDSEEQQTGGYQSFTDKYSRFTVSIGNEVYKTLDERAKAEKRNKSFFVEEALKAYFSHPPGAVQEPAEVSHQEESSGLQDSLNQILERLNQQQVQIESFSDSLNQVSERTESFQNQIDAVKMQAAASSQVISRPPAAKKAHEVSIDISSIEEIQSEKNYPLLEAVSILEKFSKKPLTSNALRMRCKRALDKDDTSVGYSDDNGYHIKGSYLLSYLKPEIVQKSF